MAFNVWRLAEGGVFGAPTVKLPLIFIHSGKVSLTTSAPLFGKVLL
jgi:hypothetical protein